MRHTHRAGGRAGRVRSVQVPARQNARARAFACECVRGSLESIGSRGPRMTRIHHTIRHACMHNTLSSYLIRQLLAQQPCCAHLNGLKKIRNNILIPPPSPLLHMICIIWTRMEHYYTSIVILLNFWGDIVLRGREAMIWVFFWRGGANYIGADRRYFELFTWSLANKISDSYKVRGWLGGGGRCPPLLYTTWLLCSYQEVSILY